MTTINADKIMDDIVDRLVENWHNVDAICEASGLSLEQMRSLRWGKIRYPRIHTIEALQRALRTVERRRPRRRRK